MFIFSKIRFFFIIAVTNLVLFAAASFAHATLLHYPQLQSLVAILSDRHSPPQLLNILLQLFSICVCVQLCRVAALFTAPLI